MHERSFVAEDANRISYEYQWYPEVLTPVNMSGSEMVKQAMKACGEPTLSQINCDGHSPITQACAAARSCVQTQLKSFYQSNTGIILTLL